MLNNVTADHIKQELERQQINDTELKSFTETGAIFTKNGKDVEVDLGQERVTEIESSNPEWDRPNATARELVKAAADGKGKATDTAKKTPATAKSGPDAVAMNERGANTPKN